MQTKEPGWRGRLNLDERKKKKKNHCGLSVSLYSELVLKRPTATARQGGISAWLLQGLYVLSNNLLHTLCFPLESDKVCLRGHFRDHLIVLEMSLLGASL